MGFYWGCLQILIIHLYFVPSILSNCRPKSALKSILPVQFMILFRPMTLRGSFPSKEFPDGQIRMAMKPGLSSMKPSNSQKDQ